MLQVPPPPSLIPPRGGGTKLQLSLFFESNATARGGGGGHIPFLTSGSHMAKTIQTPDILCSGLNLWVWSVDRAMPASIRSVFI